MIFKVINIVRNFLKEYYPTVDVYDGPMYDLFIKGFGILFKREIDKINANTAESIQGSLDIRNYATMARSDLARIGAMYFLTPSDGGYASSILTLELSKPVKCHVQEGDVFGTTSGLRFYAARTVSFSASQMANAQVGDKYTMKVPVTAAKAGSEYEVEAGAINTVISSLNVPVVRVYNASAATGGSDSETNTEFYLRLVRSINTRELLITDASIKTTLGAAFPTLRAITVAGKGHPMMQRDRVYDSFSPEGLSPYERSDFFAKRKGTKIYNTNVALSGRLDSATPPTLDNVESAVSEVTQEDYYDLFALDVKFMVTRAGLEFSDDFNPTSRATGVVRYHSDDWVFSDSGFTFGKTRYGDSVRISGGYLCLGAEEVTTLSVKAV